MAFILHPINYAIKKTVNAVLKTPERGARISGLTSIDDDQHNLEHEYLAFDPEKGFKPTYKPLTLRKRPKTDHDAQILYNHMRTIAWYADSLPLPIPLPFHIGLDAIVGFIPYIGDIIGSLMGLYIIYIAALFGIPIRVLGIMLGLVIADTLVGLIPILGDAIDVAFKSNIYILHLFEHHLTQTRGKCSAGEFQIVMPPSAIWMPSKSQRKSAARNHQQYLDSHPDLQQQQQSHNQSQAPQVYRASGSQSQIPIRPQSEAHSSFFQRGEASTSGTSTPPGGLRNLGGGGRRAVPASEHECSLPAMPLSLPPEFMSRNSTDSIRNGRSSDVSSEDVEHLAPSHRTRRSTTSSSDSNNHRESVLYSTMLGGVVPAADTIANAGDEADVEYSSDEEDDALRSPNETTKMLFAPTMTGPSSPGKPRIGQRRSRSTLRSETPKRTRGVSWHADIAGGLDDDEDEDDDEHGHVRNLESGVARQHSTLPRSLRPTSSTSHAFESMTASPIAPSPSSSLKGRRARYLMIYSAIFAIAYVTSLDANTGYLYLNFACSEFGALASFSTVAICQQMIYAIAKPPIAKLSDVFGRAEALLFSLSLYSSGYAIVATAGTLRTLIGGIILQSAGNTGVQVLQSIIIADLTTAKWRGLVISLVNLPYLINFAVAGPLVDAVMQSSGWRVGYGMWIGIVPLAAAPLVIILAVGQRQARNAGLLERRQIFGRGCGAAIAHLASEIDALGLLLFTLAWTLILGPLTMAGHGSYSDQSLAGGLILTGFVLIGLFIFWETRASNPIMPLRFLKNRAVVCVCLIGILDFASFYLSWTYLSAFVQIVKGWGQTQTGYFAMTQNVTSTIVGILVGSLMACTRRFKAFLVAGVLVRLIGVGLMIRYRNSHDPTIMLVLCQLLQGIGGGSVAITMQIAAQICVRHADVAIVTALELLTTEIGAAMGSATAGLIFTNLLPGKLRANLPNLSEMELLEIYGSLSKVTSFPMGSAERIAIGNAWTETMRELCIVATLILLPTIPLSIAIPDFILPDSHRRRSHHSHSHGLHRNSTVATTTTSSPASRSTQQLLSPSLQSMGNGQKYFSSSNSSTPSNQNRGKSSKKYTTSPSQYPSNKQQQHNEELNRPPLYSKYSHDDGFSSSNSAGTATHSKYRDDPLTDDSSAAAGQSRDVRPYQL
ncbi:unnamed protein product [Sympodiomycopsis kandeliae]